MMHILRGGIPMEEEALKRLGPPKTKKLLFLDVDGVLNRVGTQGRFEDSCFAALRHIIAETGAQLVLSSSWRLNPSDIDELSRKLIETGVVSADIVHIFVGSTPDWSTRAPHLQNRHPTRANEIMAWIYWNTLKDTRPITCLSAKWTASSVVLEPSGERWTLKGMWMLATRVELEQFLVLDHEDLGYTKWSPLDGHFVQTVPERGLDMERACEAVRILNSPFDFVAWRQKTFPTDQAPASSCKSKPSVPAPCSRGRYQ